MPLAIHLSDQARRRWFDSYLSQALSSDVPELEGTRRLDALARLFERLASQTGQLLNVSNAAAAIGLEARTADNYAHLLADLFLLRQLPAWGRTLRSRTGKTAKLHVVDSGLGAHMMRLTPAKLAQLDPASTTEFGHLLGVLAPNGSAPGLPLFNACYVTLNNAHRKVTKTQAPRSRLTRLERQGARSTCCFLDPEAAVPLILQQCNLTEPRSHRLEHQTTGPSTV